MLTGNVSYMEIRKILSIWAKTNDVLLIKHISSIDHSHVRLLVSVGTLL